ncbi:MAG: zinc-ribbon domain containing protein [bacterium]|nr:zinc-ribbon domain containing protein [bacterium]
MAAITQTCAQCGKQFLVIDQEQKFLNDKGLPLPKNCPTCRQKRRLALRGSERTLYKTKCQKCGTEIVVAYDPSKVTNTILCKKDYDQYFLENDPIIKDPLPEV